MKLSPYLYFNGNCAEAMRFYAELLGGEAQIMTYAQMPSDPDMPPLSEADKTKVAHSQLLRNGECLFSASDSLPMFCDEGGFKPMQGFQVAIDVDTVAEGERIFKALAAGGQVQMPFAETFWAKGFGIVTDRFGTPWMVNAELCGD
ncbi:hypothetical protein CO610_05385 [Lysobacteraceae bacterium NML95-0200]|nr:hypothetical protein CO610_05385 [Xanthomonadaceae bacterium NML95-0200]